jgi:hypothetical protein
LIEVHFQFLGDMICIGRETGIQEEQLVIVNDCTMLGQLRRTCGTEKFTGTDMTVKPTSVGKPLTKMV